MDVGTTNDWRSAAVVPAAELLDRIAAVHPIEALEPATRGEVARRWRYADGRGEVGIIASVTQPFCTDCTRARVTATGELFTCLFAAHGRDLRGALRAGASDAELADLIGGVWAGRSDRYSELRGGAAVDRHRAEMSYLGG
jgi:cyclic pyranopterin phosphate synthase